MLLSISIPNLCSFLFRFGTPHFVHLGIGTFSRVILRTIMKRPYRFNESKHFSSQFAVCKLVELCLISGNEMKSFAVFC